MDTSFGQAILSSYYPKLLDDSDPIGGLSDYFAEALSDLDRFIC